MASEGEPFARRVAVAVALLASIGLVVALFVLGVQILLAAFGGILLAVLLHAASEALKRHTPLSYPWALTVVTVALALALVGAAWFAAPRIAREVEDLGEQLPILLSEIEGSLERRAAGRWVLRRAESVMDGTGGDLDVLYDWASYVLVVVFVGLFAAASPRLYVEGTVQLFPIRHRERVRELLARLGHTLRWWLIGQALAMVVIGVSTFFVLLAFDMPLPFVLGGLVGLLGFVPYLGPLVGGIPIAMIAATRGATELVTVMSAYVVVQTLEGYVVTPLIQRRMVYLPPVLTIVSQVLLGVVLGVLGFVFATPLAAVLLVLSRFYRAHVLGDEAAWTERRRERRRATSARSAEPEPASS